MKTDFNLADYTREAIYVDEFDRDDVDKTRGAFILKNKVEKLHVKPFEGNEAHVIREFIGQAVMHQLANTIGGFTVAKGGLVNIPDTGLAYYSVYKDGFESIESANKKLRGSQWHARPSLEVVHFISFLLGEDDRHTGNVGMDLFNIDFGRFGYISGNNIKGLNVKYKEIWDDSYKPGIFPIINDALILELLKSESFSTSFNTISEVVNSKIEELRSYIPDDDLSKVDFKIFNVNTRAKEIRNFANWNEFKTSIINQIKFNFEEFVPQIQEVLQRAVKPQPKSPEAASQEASASPSNAAVGNQKSQSPQPLQASASSSSAAVGTPVGTPREKRRLPFPLSPEQLGSSNQEGDVIESPLGTPERSPTKVRALSSASSSTLYFSPVNRANVRVHLQDGAVPDRTRRKMLFGGTSPEKENTETGR